MAYCTDTTEHRWRTALGVLTDFLDPPKAYMIMADCGPVIMADSGPMIMADCGPMIMADCGVGL